MLLHKRRRQTQQELAEPQESAASARVVLCHFPALLKGLLEVALRIHDRVAVRIEAAVLKVMVQAAVVQIDRTAGRQRGRNRV